MKYKVISSTLSIGASIETVKIKKKLRTSKKKKDRYVHRTTPCVYMDMQLSGDNSMRVRETVLVSGIGDFMIVDKNSISEQILYTLKSVSSFSLRSITITEYVEVAVLMMTIGEGTGQPQSVSRG